MNSTLDDFFGDNASEKVCACGETENLKGFSYNVMTGDYGIWVCPKCLAEADARSEDAARHERSAVKRAEENTEENDG